MNVSDTQLSVRFALGKIDAAKGWMTRDRFVKNVSSNGVLNHLIMEGLAEVNKFERVLLTDNGRALLKARVPAELHVWEAMPHAGFGGAAPEDVEVSDAIRDFVDRVFEGG